MSNRYEALYVLGVILALCALVAMCSGCANKEDTNNLIDVLTLPFKLIGM